MHKVLNKNIIPTQKEFPLYGSGPIEEKSSAAAKTFDIAEDIVKNLMHQYGTRYVDVLKYTINDQDMKKRICS